MVTECIKPDGRRWGASPHSEVYCYGPHLYDWMTLWNVRGPNGYTWDMGLDHFILTADGDFERVEFRVMGKTIAELPGGER